MIVAYVLDIVRRIGKLRCAVAAALLLPLLSPLAVEPAQAHYLRQAPSARLHLYHGAVRAVAGARSWRRAPARRVAVFAPSWRHRARIFAAARPRLQRHAAFLPATQSTAGSSGVIAEALRYVGAGNVTGAKGAWCADYASMILRRTGHHPLANRTVSAALAYGPRVRQPQPGDLVVINTRAGYAQHVGFFAGWNHGQMVMVSGNWGHRVAVSPSPPGAVAAFIGV